MKTAGAVKTLSDTKKARSRRDFGISVFPVSRGKKYQDSKKL